MAQSRMVRRFAFLIAVAATPLLSGLASPARAADVAMHRERVRSVTVTRTAMVVDCRPVPAIVAPGRRGMGEPGTYYARWDYVVPRGCPENP